jgi:hypothetical protein
VGTIQKRGLARVVGGIRLLRAPVAQGCRDGGEMAMAIDDHCCFPFDY